jgi:hypothetical protein
MISRTKRDDTPAATRFGVSASSAIRWVALARKAGSVAPGPLGGDRRLARIEVHAALILQLVNQSSAITLKEIRGKLAAEPGDIVVLDILLAQQPGGLQRWLGPGPWSGWVGCHSACISCMCRCSWRRPMR